MPENKQYRRVCITRAGYAVVPGDTDEEAVENAKKLGENGFDWEPVDAVMIGDEAEVLEVCGPNGEPIPEGNAT